jgi:hypothetical protein
MSNDKIKMAVFSSPSQLKDFGYYPSIAAARRDWNNGDAPRGAHHAIIETSSGTIRLRGRKGLGW